MKGLILLFILLQVLNQSFAQANVEKETTSTKNLSAFLLEELKGLDESSKEVQFLKGSLDFLEIKDRKSAMFYGLKPSQSSVIYCYNGIPFIYPPFSQTEIAYSEDLCLKWFSANTREYKVEIKNYFGDILMGFVSSSDEVILKKADLDKFIEKESRILISVKDNSSKDKPEYFPLRKAADKEKVVAYSCIPEKPIVALISGLYIERTFNVEGKAKTYYELAAKLSDNHHYQTLLENFNLRNKKQ